MKLFERQERVPAWALRLALTKARFYADPDLFTVRSDFNVEHQGKVIGRLVFDGPFDPRIAVLSSHGSVYAGQSTCVRCGNDQAGERWPTCGELVRLGWDQQSAHDSSCRLQFPAECDGWLCSTCETLFKETEENQ